MTFQVGDIVSEKWSTGNPHGKLMTVFRVTGDRVFCQWFDESALKDGAFRSKDLIQWVRKDVCHQAHPDAE